MPLLSAFSHQPQPGATVPDHAGNFGIPNPALDRQAAENIIGDMIADSLRTLSAFLETNTGQHAGLEIVFPIVTQAAHRSAARDYAQAFNLIWLAYRAIETSGSDPGFRRRGRRPTHQT